MESVDVNAFPVLIGGRGCRRRFQCPRRRGGSYGRPV
jgi:hypothetical protein